MRQVSCGKFGLGDEPVEGGIQAFRGVGERAVRRLRATVEELREAGTQDTGVELGEEQRDALAEVGDLIALRVRDAGDESVQPEPAQVIGHPSRGVCLQRDAEQRGDVAAQCGIAESLGQEHEQAQCLQQGHDAGVAERQGGGALAVDEARQIRSNPWPLSGGHVGR